MADSKELEILRVKIFCFSQESAYCDGIVDNAMCPGLRWSI